MKNKNILVLLALIAVTSLTVDQAVLASNGPSGAPPSGNLPNATFNSVSATPTAGTGISITVPVAGTGIEIKTGLADQAIAISASSYNRPAVMATSFYSDGISGTTQNGAGTTGVRGDNNSQTVAGYGVEGITNKGVGVYGLGISTGSRGVQGQGNAFGIWGAATNDPGSKAGHFENFSNYLKNIYVDFASNTNAIEATGNVVVIGQLRATGLGQIYKTKAISAGTIAAGAINALSGIVTCDAGGRILSCGLDRTGSGSTVLSQVLMTGTTGISSCQVYAYNPSAAQQFAWAYAMCYNPNGSTW